MAGLCFETLKDVIPSKNPAFLQINTVAINKNEDSRKLTGYFPGIAGKEKISSQTITFVKICYL